MNPLPTFDDLSPAAQAYVWGYPSVVVRRTQAAQLAHGKADWGRLLHRRDLATPAYKAVVAINNDTLYSSGWFDLTLGDIEIEIPPMDHPDRYWNAMVLDAHTHLGYARRADHGTSGTTIRVTFDPSSEPESGENVLTMATPTAWVIVRVLVESPDDIDSARDVQSKFVVRAPDHASVPEPRADGSPQAVHTAGAGFFDELCAVLADNPAAPWHARPGPAAQAIIDDPASTSAEVLEAGVAEGHARIASMNLAGAVVENGWSTGGGSGAATGDLLARATGTMFGLGGHQAIENRSYVGRRQPSGDALDGDQRLLLRFGPGDLPPCDGFWSLTAYGPDLFLVDNEIERYSMGDRTPGLRRDADGGLTIELSAARPDDVSNWLPVPKGPYLLGLRVYEGHPDIVENRWFPPPLTAG